MVFRGQCTAGYLRVSLLRPAKDPAPDAAQSPAVPLNPFLGFCFGLKFAEVVRGFVWPRYSDAPITRLRDRR
jgi:hypothetical protein